MPDLIPVDHDPFAPPTLIPVDHDPFAGDQVQVPPQEWRLPDLAALTGMPSAMEQSAAATAANPWQPGMTAGQVLAGRPDDPLAGSFQPGVGVGAIKPSSLWYHGGQEAFNVAKAGSEVYMTSDPAQALQYARGVHLGGYGSGEPRITAISPKSGKIMNVDDILFDAMDNGDDLQDALNAAFPMARQEGARYVEYTHPNAGAQGEHTVRVSLYPQEDLGVGHNDIIKKYGLAGLVAGGATTIGGSTTGATHLIPVEHDPFDTASLGPSGTGRPLPPPQMPAVPEDKGRPRQDRDHDYKPTQFGSMFDILQAACVR